MLSYASQKCYFGPGLIEVSHVLQRMQLANKLGLEGVTANDSNND